MQLTKQQIEININEYSRYLDSEENPFEFISPENSITIKLLRNLQREIK